MPSPLSNGFGRAIPVGRAVPAPSGSTRSRGQRPFLGTGPGSLVSSGSAPLLLGMSPLLILVLVLRFRVFTRSAGRARLGQHPIGTAQIASGSTRLGRHSFLGKVSRADSTFSGDWFFGICFHGFRGQYPPRAAPASGSTRPGSTRPALQGFGTSPPRLPPPWLSNATDQVGSCLLRPRVPAGAAPRPRLVPS